jgi:hypothetical protein
MLPIPLFTVGVKMTNGTHAQNLGKYLDIVKNKWFNKIEDM